MKVILMLGLLLGTQHIMAASNSTGAFVFNLVGSGDMYMSTVPDIDGDGQDDPAMCFDVNLASPQSGRNFGTATDCLANVQDGANGGLVLVGTTFFRTPFGDLTTRGLTTVQPVNGPTREFTHITGANGVENAILSGTGYFEGAQGTVRLSGMVDMSAFAGNPGDSIKFDCLFVVKLQRD